MNKVADLSQYKAQQAKRQTQEVKRKALLQQYGAIEPTSNFFRVSHETLTCQRFIDLPVSAKALFLILCHLRNRYQRGKAYFTRSDRQLVKDTNMARATVKRAAKLLHEEGFLLFANRNRGRTRYQIIDSKPSKALIQN